ncbi:MAG: TetR/AcrR family transcriptional regulator [Deltaproteobacteria bacterium]|nr:MAG: TetR/AcrR family transcriptional regulator [Deltaproteobacteria bacterium]
MGIEERRNREKLARREAIIVCARELFLAKGFNATTMDEIAQRAELSKGTLYLYFNSKEELYVTVMSEGLKILFDRIEETFNLDLPPDQVIRKLGEVYYRYYLDHRDYFRILFFLEHGDVSKQLPRELIQANLDKGIRCLQLFAGVVQNGIEEGIFSPVDPRKAALAFWGATNGILFLFEEELNREIIGMDVEQLIYYTLDLFIKGLLKK